MQTHVFNYHEPKVVISSARFLTSFSNGLNSLLSFILFIPVFILALVYYPILIIALQVLKNKSDKLLAITKKDYSSLSFNEARDYYARIETTITSFRGIVDEGGGKKSDFLAPLVKRSNQVLHNFQEMEDIMRNVLFVDTSKASYTVEEKELFSDLNDFFGEASEVYEKDTFEQLKSQGAKV